jgi:uncharacterized protein YraI
LRLAILMRGKFAIAWRMHGNNESDPRRIMSPDRACGRGLALALQVTSLVAALTGCSDPGIVTAQSDLQEAPSAHSKVLTMIPKGSPINVGDCSDGWCRVSWNGFNGYILTKSIRLAEGSHRSAGGSNQPSPYNEDDAGANPDVPPVAPSAAD